jgi:O6-methylguanine-DNA--protein-cysteine methyltransferase
LRAHIPLLRGDRHTNTRKLEKKAPHYPESPTHELHQTTATIQHLEQEIEISTANEDRESEPRTPVNVVDKTNQQSELLQEMPKSQALSRNGRPLKPASKAIESIQEL